MNIFIMILVAVFMAGYYLLDSPSQNLEQHATEYAISQSNMRTIAQCATAAHNAQLAGYAFEDICVEDRMYIKILSLLIINPSVFCCNYICHIS